VITFHRFLIGTAIVFSAGFAVWALVSFRRHGGVLVLGLGLFFTVAAVALAYYLKNLNRFLGR
jgi:hypothetical protein